MDERICSVSECGRATYQNKPMCGSHYMKWYRHGDPNFAAAGRRLRDLTGQRFGMLMVIGRDDDRWVARCDCGAETKVLSGGLLRGSTTSCGDRGHRRRQVVGYYAVHDRLVTDLGKAASYPCVDCGGQAADWSYDHLDRDEIEGRYGPFSLDQERYQPRCKPCHKLFDSRHRRAIRNLSEAGKASHGG